MSNPALEVIDGRIQKLQADIQEFEGQLAVAKQEIQLAGEQLAILTSLRDEIAQKVGAKPVGRSNGSAKGPGVTDAIAAMLSTHGPKPGKAIADALEHRLVSGARNKRRLIYNTLFNMVKSGRLRKHGQDYVIATNEGVDLKQ